LFSIHAAHCHRVRSLSELTGLFRLRRRNFPMTSFTKFLPAAALVGLAATPAAAQYNPYPSQQGYDYPAYPGQASPQQYPPQQTYPGYPQGYGQGYPVTDVIDQLLGTRYSITDRQAVRQCARAATAQAQSQYGGGYGGYGQQYGQQYGQGYNRSPGMRVTAITDVQRRSTGLRVSGLLSSGGGYGGGYGGQYGYQNRGYAQGELSFRCNVDYRGAITGLRVRPANYR
jgi:hypothetical protein